MTDGILVTEVSVKAERDPLLEELNRYRIKNEQSKKLILEVNAAIKAMSTRLVDLEQKVATIETVKRLLAKSSAELLSSAR